MIITKSKLPFPSRRENNLTQRFWTRRDDKCNHSKANPR